MKKQLLAGLLAAAAFSSAHALTTGDIAFTSFNADEDGFAIVAFTNIAANTTIYFRDDSWNGAAFGATEGVYTWNSGTSVINAGTVVRFSAVDAAGRSASFGSIAWSGANVGLSATSETIYAFTGVDANTPASFLTAVSTEGAATVTVAGLANGVNAVVLTASTDYAEYTGTRSGELSFGAYRPMVNNPGNWNILVGGAQQAQIPNTTAFTISPIPEPETWGMLLAGLGLLGAVARRRG
ncbi:MAG: FxDxF family PEP-CTERM protein [Burkholderiales bacterium]